MTRARAVVIGAGIGGLAAAAGLSWRLLTDPVTGQVPMAESCGRGTVSGVMPLSDGRVYCYAAAPADPGGRADDVGQGACQALEDAAVSSRLAAGTEPDAVAGMLAREAVPDWNLWRPVSVDAVWDEAVVMRWRVDCGRSRHCGVGAIAGRHLSGHPLGLMPGRRHVPIGVLSSSG